MRRALQLCLALLLGAPAAQAQSEAKTLKILVPFAAGGGQDVMARHIGPRLADRPDLELLRVPLRAHRTS
ncbi:MAG TPA: hypothetical protein PK306_00190 [Aquabacterium sp.]|nr:hypothetical protein [Aquabacterium sp.]HQC94106.1 hypothetical protein [Aquabacterium sp.]